MKQTVVFVVLLACAGPARAQQLVASHPAPPARSVTVVVRVNDAPITSDRLDVALGRLIPQESFHRNVKAGTLDQLRKKALDSLIDEELRYQEGTRLGLTPSEAEIDAGVAQVVTRYKSRDLFEQARRQSGASIADVRREIRRALVIAKARDRGVVSRCQVSGDEASRFFADNPDRFVVPEQLRLYAITFGVDPGAPARDWTEARGRAEDVLRQIRSGAPFEEMARKHSTDKSRDRGGDMGFVHRGSLTDELEEVVRGLQVGDVSSVVQTLYGFHIVRLASIRPPEKKTFSEVAAGLQQDLTRTRCAEMDTAWSARLRAAATVVAGDDRKASGAQQASSPGDRR